MSATADLFAKLSVTDRQLSETGLVTLSANCQVEAGDVLLGLDRERRRVLLVPIGPERIRSDDRSKGVRIRVREFGDEDEGATKRFLALECLEPRLGLVFERLVGDILTRLAEPSKEPSIVVLSALDEWRELLRNAQQPVDADILKGLTGELEVLQRLGDASPSVALGAWTGPQRRSHDFEVEGRGIEVKATSSVDGNTITLSNVDQLDPSLFTSLHLVVAHLRETTRAPSLDEQIRGLIGSGFPADELINAVKDAGYVFESGTDDLPRYEMRGLRVWHVNSGFPGLRRSELGEKRIAGVGRISYQLALDVAPRPLGESEAQAFFDEWLR